MHYAAPRPAHSAADSAAGFHAALPRILAAIAAPERAVRGAALAALPVLAASLGTSSGEEPASLAAPYLSALAAGITRQQADFEADAGALPAALRYSLQHAQRRGKAGQTPADDRCAHGFF
jgi:hypothetical protein